MTSAERFYFLYSRYAEGIISYAEHDELFELIATGEYDDLISTAIDSDFDEPRFDDNANLPPHVANSIIQSIIEADRKITNVKKINKYKTVYWAVAVLLALMLPVAAYLYHQSLISRQFLVAFKTQNSTKIINTTNIPMRAALPDGSNILLQPTSAIYFNKQTFNKKREVYMEGEALFNVAKDPLHPFYVYYDNIVTKVLGTSFHLHTNRISGNIELEVLTGKVQIYENEKIIRDAAKTTGIMVAPNQKAVYKIKNHFFETTLVDNPTPIIDNENRKLNNNLKPAVFVFANAKISEVLKSLEDSYGIQIIVNNDAILNCVFSGNLTKEDLFNKLSIICLATASEYKVSGTKILIKGIGCTNSPPK